MNTMTQTQVNVDEQQPWRTTTAMGALLIQLYKAECSVTQIDGEDFAIWWIDKFRDPDPRDTDAWQDESLWMQGARHLHLLLQVNAPKVALVMASFLGIWTHEQKSVLHDDASEQMENLWAETHFSVNEPPYDLSAWQQPLRYKSRRAGETVHALAA